MDDKIRKPRLKLKGGKGQVESLIGRKMHKKKSEELAKMRTAGAHLRIGKRK